MGGQGDVWQYKEGVRDGMKSQRVLVRLGSRRVMACGGHVARMWWRALMALPRCRDKQHRYMLHRSV